MPGHAHARARVCASLDILAAARARPRPRARGGRQSWLAASLAAAAPSAPCSFSSHAVSACAEEAEAGEGQPQQPLGVTVPRKACRARGHREAPPCTHTPARRPSAPLVSLAMPLPPPDRRGAPSVCVQAGRARVRLSFCARWGGAAAHEARPQAGRHGVQRAAAVEHHERASVPRARGPPPASRGPNARTPHDTHIPQNGRGEALETDESLRSPARTTCCPRLSRGRRTGTLVSTSQVVISF